MIENMDVCIAKGLAVDCSEKVEEKGGFTYLSWPFALTELKKIYPYASWKVEKFIDWDKVTEMSVELIRVLADKWSLPCVPYLKTAKGAWVKILLTLDLEGLQVQEIWFPVLDNRNKPILDPSAFDINTSLQRGKVKVIAEATGVGLYIYAGEDLPSGLSQNEEEYQRALEAFKQLLAHPGMHVKVEGRADTWSDAITKKHEANGWKLKEMKADTPKVQKLCKEWEEKHDVKAVAVDGAAKQVEETVGAVDG